MKDYKRFIRSDCIGVYSCPKNNPFNSRGLSSDSEDSLRIAYITNFQSDKTAPYTP